MHGAIKRSPIAKYILSFAFFFLHVAKEEKKRKKKKTKESKTKQNPYFIARLVLMG